MSSARWMARSNGSKRRRVDMTLGRTSAGKLKIKTDGVLRAVECACCGGCGCAATISGELLTTMRNATTGTCNGAAPMQWNAQGGGFGAIWYVNGSFYTAALQSNVNCFSFNADNAMNAMASGTSAGCCPTNLPFPVTCSAVVYSINGIQFPAFTMDFGGGGFPVAPVFIFS
jgi:hypothetical protein